MKRHDDDEAPLSAEAKKYLESARYRQSLEFLADLFLEDFLSAEREQELAALKTELMLKTRRKLISSQK